MSTYSTHVIYMFMLHEIKHKNGHGMDMKMDTGNETDLDMDTGRKRTLTPAWTYSWRYGFIDAGNVATLSLLDVTN